MHVADHLTPDQLQDLAASEGGKRRFLRIRAVILALQGRTAVAVAAALGVSRRAVQGWIGRYNIDGPDGLADRLRSGRPCRLTADQLARLRDRVEAGPLPDDGVCTLRGPEVRAILGREFGVRYSQAAVYVLLHKVGLSSLDPRPRHRKADPAAQEEFRRGLAGRIQKVANEHAGNRLELWFEDEARLGQQGTPTTVRARRGSRPTAVRRTEYEYAWVMAAACPATGAAAGIVMPSLDTDVVSEFLRQFSEQLAPDVHALLIRDGAGYHTSKSLVVPANVTPLRLPPHSPELNPVENLWHYLRSHYWSNRSYTDWGALKEAACHGLLAVGTDAERMKTVCAAPYAAWGISA